MKKEVSAYRRQRLKALARTTEALNSVLADWDPIGVGAPQSSDEYNGYTTRVFRCIEANGDLFECLTQILEQMFGPPLDPIDQDEVDELNEVCEKLTKAYERSKSD